MWEYGYLGGLGVMSLEELQGQFRAGRKEHLAVTQKADDADDDTYLWSALTVIFLSINFPVPFSKMTWLRLVPLPPFALAPSKVINFLLGSESNEYGRVFCV